MADVNELLRSLPERERDELAKRALRDVVRKQATPAYRDVGNTIGALRQFHRALGDRKQFKEGDLVCWKPGLKNRIRPVYGEPAIVVKVLTEPVYDGEDNSGSSAFREPLDLVLGLIDEDNEFLVYHFDSRRFQHFEPQSSPPPSTSE